MNILFIAAVHSPFNPSQGAEQRTNLLLKACQKCGDVDVINFCNDEKISTDVNVVFNEKHLFRQIDWLDRRERINLLLSSFHHGKFDIKDSYAEKVIDSLICKKEYNLIVIRYIFPAISSGLLKYREKLYVDIDDNPLHQLRIFSHKTNSLTGKLYYKILINNFKWSLPVIIKSIYKSSFSNKKDATKYATYLLPNIPFYNISEDVADSNSETGRLLFVGDMRYSPNINSANWFISSVLPLIGQKYNVTLHIIGRCNDSIKSEWEKVPSVIVKGYVDALQEEYEKANIVILPLKEGAGTCIKFLEAAQMNRPIITTKEGYRGYEDTFISGKDCLVANNEMEFAKTIEYLISNPDIAKQITKSAHKKVMKYFSLEHFNTTVNKIITEK